MLAIAKSVQSLDLLQIGSVADRSNVPIKTIRYYEEIGLLKSLGRTEGKFLLCAADVIELIGFKKMIFRSYVKYIQPSTLLESKLNIGW